MWSSTDSDYNCIHQLSVIHSSRLIFRSNRPWNAVINQLEESMQQTREINAFLNFCMRMYTAGYRLVCLMVRQRHAIVCQCYDDELADAVA